RRLLRAAGRPPLPLHLHLLRALLALLHPRRLADVREGTPLLGRRGLAPRTSFGHDHAREEGDRMTVLHLVKTVRGATWALRQVAALRALGIEVIVALPSAREGLAPRYARAGAKVVEADLDFT